MVEFPTEQFNEINRHLLLLFEHCQTAEAVLAQQATTKQVAALKEILKNEQRQRNAER